MTSVVRRLAARTTAVLAAAGIIVSFIGIGAAQAAAPTIASFDPTSGPIGTSVEIAGTGFNDSSVVTAVTFDGTAATFSVDSNVQITAIVPAGATTGPIAVTDSEGTATSATSFTVTPSPVPAITSFDPTSGPVGSPVEITGTGFTGATAVTFDGTAATFTVDSDTQITVTVPAGATTGRIAVTTPGGTATSATDFTLTTPAQSHERSVTLKLKRHLVATGVVTADDGFTGCESGVTVKIQRRRGGRWRTVGQDETSGTGRYREELRDRVGVYRAVAVREEVNGGAGTCERAVSPRARHRH